MGDWNRIVTAMSAALQAAGRGPLPAPPSWRTKPCEEFEGSIGPARVGDC